MAAIFNYGWTGILGFLIIFLVSKYNRHIEVTLWAWHLKRHGATKREIRDYMLHKAGESSADTLVQLVKSGAGSSEGDGRAPVKGGPVAPTRPKKPRPTPGNTAPVKRKQASTARTSDRPATKPAAEITAIPGPVSTGRHARPEISDTNPEPHGRHAA